MSDRVYSTIMLGLAAALISFTIYAVLAEVL